MIASTPAGRAPGRRRRAAATVSLALAATIGACFWSTADVVAEANLELDLARVPESAALVRISVVDAAGATLAREAARSAEAMTLYVGRLAEGRAVVTTELVASTGEVVACREDAAQIGPRDRATLALDLGVAATEDEATCNDGIDNDCNGHIDCEDPACVGAKRFCQSGGCLGEQRCQGSGWGACQALKSERTYADCHDGVDNDCDGLVDCDDPDCKPPLCTSCGC